MKTFGEEFGSLVKAGFLRVVENKKFFQKAQPTFVGVWVVCRCSATDAPFDFVWNVLLFQTPDVSA